MTDAVAYTFDVPAGAAFSVDVERRTITGQAVPYGETATSRGRRFQFSQGTLKWSDPKRVKLLMGHEFAQAVGHSVQLEDRADGLYPVFRVARGPEGDRALTLAEDGVWDGLSIGVGEGKYENRDGVLHAVDVPLIEISLTPLPAFDNARVASVTASRITPTKGNALMPDEVTTITEAAPAADFSPIVQAVNDGFAALAQQLMRAPQAVEAGGGREVIDPASGLVVHEPSPYRFDGTRGQHSFSADIRLAASGDAGAKQRLEVFMGDAFAVTTGNVGSLNPTQNRPDLYVPNLTFTRPLWELCSTGVVEDVTPFTVPKFNSASGLVGNHTQGVEPTPGAFTATNQTITPTPVSGKIEINREVWDQGGSPQADQIIWTEMQNGYYEALEARIAAALQAVVTAETNLASAVDAPLVDALVNLLAGLQFVRGGNRYTSFAADGMLFPKLIGAKDSTGRKLLPVLGPENAQGTTGGGFDRVALGNLLVRAAWALGSTNVSRSFLFVPTSVWAWASAPKQMTFEYQVKSIDMAIWGYGATAILRDSDVLPIDYTTADV